MFGMKYVLAIFLCVVGCLCSMFGIGSGFDSISPHCNKDNILMK